MDTTSKRVMIKYGAVCVKKVACSLCLQSNREGFFPLILDFLMNDTNKL